MPLRKLVVLLIAALVPTLPTATDFRVAPQAGDEEFSVADQEGILPDFLGRTEEASADAHRGPLSVPAVAVVRSVLVFSTPARAARTGRDLAYCILVAGTGGSGLLSPPVAVA